MESKELPTAEQFLRKKRYGHLKDGDPPMPFQVEEWMHEYAVLFARHHVREALESAGVKSDELCFRSIKKDSERLP